MDHSLAMATAAAAKSLQSCPTLCDPIDGSPPGSADPGILQARTLEWVATSFSSAWKWKGKVKSLSRVQLFTTPRTAAHQAPLSMGFSRQENRSGLPLPSLCHGKQAYITQGSYEPCHAKIPKTDRSWRQVVESSDKMWPTRGGNPLQYSCLENPMNSMKRQRDITPEEEPPSGKVSNMLLGKSRGQLLISLQRMKPLGQSRNDAQLWMCLVVKIKSSAVKNNIA